MITLSEAVIRMKKKRQDEREVPTRECSKGGVEDTKTGNISGI
jgi:hypothetical protein